jgi:hypothetical protein
MKPKWFFDMSVLLLFVQTIFLQDAYAYIDPGMGSYFFQLLVASLFAGMYALRLWWARIRSFCAKIFKWQSK